MPAGARDSIASCIFVATRAWSEERVDETITATATAQPTRKRAWFHTVPAGDKANTPWLHGRSYALHAMRFPDAGLCALQSTDALPLSPIPRSRVSGAPSADSMTVKTTTDATSTTHVSASTSHPLGIMAMRPE